MPKTVSLNSYTLILTVIVIFSIGLATGWGWQSARQADDETQTESADLVPPIPDLVKTVAGEIISFPNGEMDTLGDQSTVTITTRLRNNSNVAPFYSDVTVDVDLNQFITASGSDPIKIPVIAGSVTTADIEFALDDLQIGDQVLIQTKENITADTTSATAESVTYISE